MAESVDALVSNTSGATRAGSTPALGTEQSALAADFRDVAQLVAHYVRDVGVGRSSRLIPTTQGCQSQELALQPLKIS